MKSRTSDAESIEYKCPYEGNRCTLNKHCHILETAGELPCKIIALVKCPIHNQKIMVEIGK